MRRNLWVIFFWVSCLRGDFQFAIFGDNQGISPFLKEIIKEVNVLKPDFIICAGDMIPGYFKDTVEIKDAWEDFKKEIENLNISFYPVPGNRDIWDKNSRDMYIKEWRRTYYSFKYRNSFFIILDTEGKGKEENSMKGKQFEWLKKELEKNKSIKHKFIFLHRPLWLYKNSNWFREIHPLLLKYNVEAVFAGHVHIYCFNEIDGIKYIITGGAGKHLSLEEEKGGFNHYLLVKVKEDSINIMVIKPGGIFPENVMTFEKIEEDIKKVLR